MTTQIEEDQLPCKGENCKEPRVSGSPYCEDHIIQAQVAARRTAAPVVGSLAQLIRNAKKQGLIAPVSSGYQSS